MKIYTKAVASEEVNEREKRNRDLAFKAACEGVVLLKNDGALPIEPGKLALYGQGARNTIKGGTGSGEVNERYSVNICEGLLNYGYEISSNAWLDDFDAENAASIKKFEDDIKKSFRRLNVKNIINMAFQTIIIPPGRPINDKDFADSDTSSCVYVLSRQAGEGDDRKLEKGDYMLSDIELQNISFCAKSYEKFVLVINCGSSIDMSELDNIDGINAILFIAQLGTEGGNALAALISGKVVPSGKLTDSWAQKYSDIPYSADFSYLNGNVDEEFYREGIYVGYRYYDTFKLAPRFEFGYGLSYTSFSIEPAGVSIDKTNVKVYAKITNTGDKYAGKEVAQLYVSSPKGCLDKEYQSLAGFAKTDVIAPQQSADIDLCFDLCEIASYREEDASYILEPGEYVVRLGNSSRNTVVAAVLTLDSEIIVSKHENICPLQKQLDLLPAPEYTPESLPDDVTKIAIDPCAFSTVEYKYEAPAVISDERVKKIMKKMSVSDMASIVVGAGFVGGKHIFSMPGSVGNSTSKFWKKGLSNVTFCDGPAGLRISKDASLDKSGVAKPLEPPISALKYMPKFLQKALSGGKADGPIYHQYATAFPVSTVLAQSWNTAIVKQIGEGISAEMSEYGCTYWLAPGMNIHRNPLCGRNFEYFSEDPMLSGAIASALITGVQTISGHYVTPKHYACNNQEVNRNKVDSVVSERALREIYLRGFGIAVKKAHSTGLMSSYNRLNGVYTPNSYDLLTKVLRNEWGFEGVVTTDWYSTMMGQASDALCIKAGNDIIMPGGGMFAKKVVKGVRKGIITKTDLRRCCANVVKSILDSETQKEYIKY